MIHGEYLWRQDLLSLDSEAHTGGCPYFQGELSPVQLHLKTWEQLLEGHPDSMFQDYIIKGQRDGFRVGFHEGSSLKTARRNLPSAYEHGEVVSDYLAKEKSLGRIVGPIDELALQQERVHINPFGVIPKKTPGKWRLILDLSAPRGHSINDGIEEQVASLGYVAIDNVAEVILAMGGEVFLGKCDIMSAYRIIPVHPGDRRLLGMKWQDDVYIDTRLPFGLRSAPKVFTAVADALQWILRSKGGIEFIFHYIDDFIVLEQTPEKCALAMNTIEEVATSLGITLEPSKTEGPSQTLTFLGIQVDTVKGELRLPEGKLSELLELLARWQG